VTHTPTTSERTRMLRHVVLITLALLVMAGQARAGQQSPTANSSRWDVTVYGGLALPTYEQTFTFGVSIPQLPGVDITPAGDLTLTASGGPVFGGSLGWQAGLFGAEGRVDTAGIDIETGGIRFDLAIPGFPPDRGPLGSIVIGDGSFDLKRLVVLSVNGRLRTPGPVGVLVSGGLSYLPHLEATGAVPISLEFAALPALPELAASLRLVALPSQKDYAFGGNVGGGVVVRLSPRVSLLVEGRLFAFRDFELGYEWEDGAVPGLDDLLGRLPTATFTPVYFHGAAGLAFSF
jgi:hypothetical protein